MIHPSQLMRQHAEVIVARLATALDSPDPRARLRAATQLLRLGWGPPGALADDDASAVARQQALAALLSQATPDEKPPNPSATSCPARHAADAAAPATESPCPEAAANPMSSEAAATPPPPAPGANPARDDADPISRAMLPAGHSSDAAFRRRLPPPPDIEPPWPSQRAGPGVSRRHQRWLPWP